jgi:hypothetical protein
MKQTAGECFLEWYNSYVKKHGCSPSDYDVNYFWKHDFSIKEKEQIIDAYNQGSLDTYKKDPKNGQGTKYYNETYGNR